MVKVTANDIIAHMIGFLGAGLAIYLGVMLRQRNQRAKDNSPNKRLQTTANPARDQREKAVDEWVR